MIPKAALLFLVLAAAAGNLFAEVMYVVDSFEVPVRKGKGIEYRILALVKSDESVEVLAVEDEYAMVRTEKGTQGWMLKRYLTEETPRKEVIEGLRGRIARIEERRGDLEAENKLLTKKNAELEARVERSDSTVTALQNKHSELEESCAEHLILVQKHENLQKEVHADARTIAELNRENERLRRNNNLKWFVAGGSAILAGFIIGMVLQALRNKKRRRLSF